MEEFFFWHPAPLLRQGFGRGSVAVGDWPSFDSCLDFTNEAAARFAVFEAWAPRTMAAGTQLQAPLRLPDRRGTVVDE
jgi:hypothetical protein